jgi:spore coat protein U-like protein
MIDKARTARLSSRTWTSALLLTTGLGLAAGALAGGTTPLTVNAKISGVCKVTTAPGTLDFGTIDPSGAANATASATFVMKCTNGTLSTAATDGAGAGGLPSSGGFKRMQHSVIATAFLPYAIVYAGDTGFAGAGFGGAAATKTVTINGTVLVADYASALATTGVQVYADTVTITVNP